MFVFHDSFIKTAFLSKKIVKETEFEQIRQLRTGVIEFSELVEKLPEHKFVIELKAYTDYQYIIDTVCEKHINKDTIDRFRFISFAIDALKHVKKVNPAIHCTYISTCIDAPRFEPFATKKHLNLCLQFNINEISGHWLSFRPAVISLVKAAGLEVGLGMINGSIEFNYCLKNSVERIYTDNIAKIVQLINHKKAERI